MNYHLKATQENKGWCHHLAFCLLRRSTPVSESLGSAETSGTTQLCASFSPCPSLPTSPPTSSHFPMTPQKPASQSVLTVERADLRLYFKSLNLEAECRRNRKRKHTNRRGPGRAASALFTTFIWDHCNEAEKNTEE